MPEASDRWAHTAKESGHVGPTLSALGHFLVSIFCTMSSFYIKNDVVFFSDLISAKTIRKENLLKTASDSAVLFKYGKISEQIMKQSDWKSRCILGASPSKYMEACEKSFLRYGKSSLTLLNFIFDQFYILCFAPMRILINYSQCYGIFPKKNHSLKC